MGFGSACSLASDYLFYVYAPKYVTIYNKRLGMLFRALQVAACVWVVTSLVRDKPWLREYAVRPYAHADWSEEGPNSTVSRNDVEHCVKPGDYSYRAESGGVLTPSRCSRQLHGDKVKSTTSDLFVSTLVWDTFTMEEHGENCASTEERTCGRAGAGNATCSCRQEDIFLSKNVEEDFVHFHHGYSASYAQDFFFSKEPVTEMATSKSPKVVTKLENDVGEPCSVGGKSVWRHEDSQKGIYGTVGEWLACSGHTLDEKSPFATSGGEVPRLRMVGGEVNVQFEYAREAVGLSTDGEVWCTVKVKFVPKWNTWETLTYLEPLIAGQEPGSYRWRRSYGLSFKSSAHGAVQLFSSSQFLTVIVNAIVIITFPANIIYWIILYGVGLLSAIYYKAACEDLNVHHHVCGVGVRMLASMASFRSLTRQIGVPFKQLEPMTGEELFKGMCAVLSKQMKGGTLDYGEVEQIVYCMMDTLDEDRSLNVCIDEYIQAYCCTEIMDLQEVAQLFDGNRRMCFGEWILHDTPPNIQQRHREMLKKGGASNSFRVDMDEISDGEVAKKSEDEGSSTETDLKENGRKEKMLRQDSADTTQSEVAEVAQRAAREAVREAVADVLHELPLRMQRLELSTQALCDVPERLQRVELASEALEELTRRLERLEEKAKGFMQGRPATPRKVELMREIAAQSAQSDGIRELEQRLQRIEASLQANMDSANAFWQGQVRTEKEAAKVADAQEQLAPELPATTGDIISSRWPASQDRTETNSPKVSAARRKASENKGPTSRSPAAPTRERQPSRPSLANEVPPNSLLEPAVITTARPTSRPLAHGRVRLPPASTGPPATASRGFASRASDMSTVSKSSFADEDTDGGGLQQSSTSREVMAPFSPEIATATLSTLRGGNVGFEDRFAWFARIRRQDGAGPADFRL